MAQETTQKIEDALVEEIQKWLESEQGESCIKAALSNAEAENERLQKGRQLSLEELHLPVTL